MDTWQHNKSKAGRPAGFGTRQHRGKTNHSRRTLKEKEKGKSPEGNVPPCHDAAVPCCLNAL